MVIRQYCFRDAIFCIWYPEGVYPVLLKNPGPENQSFTIKINLQHHYPLKIILKPIEAPPSKWDSPLAVFKATLEHEQKVTSLINELIYLARSEKDNASEIFLQWFVSEQVEEEKNGRDMIGKLKLIEGSQQALYMLDQESAQRVYTPPAANA